MTTAAVGATSAALADAVQKPQRKFPLPCWTQEETLALIDAYRDRWYALRRGYLRSPDWDAVAATVSSRCPDASPAKTSAQCRHKMEKLRQRYRAEKQRAVAFPAGRFFSSWFFFDNMDALENGTSVSAVRPEEEPGNHDKSDYGFRLKTFLDQNVLKLKLNPEDVTKFERKVDMCPKFASDDGVRVKSRTKINSGRVSINVGSKFLKGYSPYLDIGSYKEDDEEDERNSDGGFNLNDRSPGTMMPSGFKGKNFGQTFEDLHGGCKTDLLGGKGCDIRDGFYAQSLGEENLLLPRFRAKKFGNVDGRVKRGGVECEEEENNSLDANVGFWVKVASNRNSVPAGLRGKYGLISDSDSKGLNGFSNLSGLVMEKGNVGGANKRERNPIEEIVLSIKMLGEDFVKMERMKMEMAMEIEKSRMEMEIKRNELLLESQRQIVDAFVKGLSEIKNKKVKMAAAPEV